MRRGQQCPGASAKGVVAIYGGRFIEPPLPRFAPDISAMASGYRYMALIPFRSGLASYGVEPNG